MTSNTRENNEPSSRGSNLDGVGELKRLIDIGENATPPDGHERVEIRIDRQKLHGGALTQLHESNCSVTCEEEGWVSDIFRGSLTELGELLSADGLKTGIVPCDICGTTHWKNLSYILKKYMNAVFSVPVLLTIMVDLENEPGGAQWLDWLCGKTREQLQKEGREQWQWRDEGPKILSFDNAAYTVGETTAACFEHVKHQNVIHGIIPKKLSAKAGEYAVEVDLEEHEHPQLLFLASSLYEQAKIDYGNEFFKPGQRQKHAEKAVELARLCLRETERTSEEQDTARQKSSQGNQRTGEQT